MALDLKLNISTTDDCKNLVIEDVTGLYNETSNPGGWGSFNISGNREEFNLNLSLIVYLILPDGTQYTTPVFLSNFANTVIYPSEDTYRGFKVSVPAYDISTEVANFPGIPESYEPIQEVLDDNIYKVFANITSSNYNKEFQFTFKNICTSQKIVERLMGTINLGCEDCDDSDIERALLAKSLLESIKNMQ